MENFLFPEPIGQWIRFVKEFEQFLLAVGKGDASGAVKIAIILTDGRRCVTPSTSLQPDKVL